MRTLQPWRMAESNFRGIRSGGVATLALMLTLVACGGATQSPAAAIPSQPQGSATVVPTLAPSTAPAGGSVTIEACALATPDEVSTTAGIDRVSPVPSADDLYSYCTYSAPGAPEIRIFVAKSAATSSSVFNTMKVNKGEAVSGVGDEAYWSTDSFQPGLYFMTGGILGYVSGPATGPEAPIVALGKLLASRIAEQL